MALGDTPMTMQRVTKRGFEGRAIPLPFFLFLFENDKTRSNVKFIMSITAN